MIKYACIFIFFAAQAFGQLQQTARFEQEIKRSENGFTIIPADSLGLYLFQETDKYEGRDKIWSLIFLDRDLKQQRTDTLLINNKYLWIGHEYNSGYLYLLFRQGEYNQSDLHVIRINTANGNFRSFSIKNEIEFDITFFSVCNNSALMGGYVNQRPTLIIYEFANEQIKVLPGYYLKDARLLDITVNVNNTFNVLINNEKDLSDKYLELKVFDSKGALLAEDIFYVPEDKQIMTGLTSRLYNDNLIVTGTFGSSNSKLTEGIFWGKADLSNKRYLTTVPYSSFNSLYDHLPEKRREKLKEKAKEKMLTDKYFEKEHVYLHRILEEDGMFYLLMELFDPYTTRTNDVMTPYSMDQRLNHYRFSRYYSRYNTGYSTDEFTNIKYQQGIVASFNEKGNLLWDQSLVFDDKESDQLEQVSDITVKDEKVAIAYKEKDALKWKLVSGTENVNDSTVNIMMSQTSDILRNELDEEGGIRYWYDGAMYIWGYQSIRRQVEEGSDDRLYVFYINKMEVVE